jgi:5-methylcytosine-specific restriction endonuclease McrA
MVWQRTVNPWTSVGQVRSLLAPQKEALVPDAAELKSQRWRKICEKLKREREPVCWICNNDIDLEISGRDKQGWTLDHVIPRHQDPTLTYVEANLRPAHNLCNAKRMSSLWPGVRYSKKWG